VAALSALRDKPAGTIRITSVEHASDAILAPALARLLPDYPDIRVEITNDYGLTDIVTERYDAGVRLGEQVDKDMIGVRIGPDFRMALVGAPSYFTRQKRPRTPHDLTAHACINLRLPTTGGLWTWPFAKDGRELRVRADGPLVFNTVTLILRMAVAGLGLAYVPDDLVQAQLAAGRLVRVLDDWSPPVPGYHLYYPSRRQPAPAFGAMVNVGVRGQAAACSSAACTGSPSRKRTPWITWASRSEPSSRRQLRSADLASL
jgi:DNA-binding transcriptional LysR family regulator